MKHCLAHASNRLRQTRHNTRGKAQAGTAATLRVSRVAAAVMLALSAAPQFALGGPGFGETTNPTFANGTTATFYANSPTGLYPANACYDDAGRLIAPALGGACDSGTALRKFVDTLPGLGAGAANNLGNYISVGAPDTTTYPDADYYEIAVIEYTQQMHSQLPKATTLRGYVQIDPAATDAVAHLANGAVGPASSQRIALVNPDGSPVMIARPDASNATGFKQVQAYAVDKPSYLGPAVVAQSGRPVRFKFYNALPVGRAANGARLGDLFLPVDETLPGGGFGPDGKVKFTQNRAAVHLHGGDTPWISDGTPHQWIAPAGEVDATNGASVAAEAAAKKVSATPYLRGPSTVNVPDMPDPGPGATTYYFTNKQSARLMWYHDHTLGLTRVNAYAGMAAPYVLTDAQEANLNAGALSGVPVVPLVIQDKTFVPANIARQDARWDATLWGKPGDLWFPHVIETNQDPMSADGTNPVGRWDWGPFFWPVFPSAMDLPTGEHKIYAPGTRTSFTNTVTGSNLPGPSDLGMTEVTTTPEAFNDTPVINGTAYPTLTVEPKTYRFRMLNGANDRLWNLGLYVAADANTVDANDPLGTYPNVKLCDGTEGANAICSEVRMVPFVGPNSPTSTTFNCDPATGMTPVTAAYSLAFPCAGGLLGTGWGQQDNRPGGVPDPRTKGPSMWLIGTEGGFVPAPVEIPSTPFNYEYNKRSVTVLNVLEHGVMLGGAERADVLVDFSQYAGKTLILYNDSAAPVPAGDPRLDYYTGVGDQTAAGGAPNTLPGYGPNTRTIMQIKVAAGAPATAFDFSSRGALAAQLRSAYDATQAKPIVPQTAYGSAYTTDTYASIFTGAVYLNKYQALSFTTTGALTYTPAPTCSTAATCQTAIDTIKAKGPVTVATGTAVSAYVESKAIQELFDPTWGRMNATLGVELPFTSALNQTTIPLGYVDPATEKVADGETQFWKITHNGVDTHPVHFHLVNVQVINRVGWDGTVKPPLPEEIGWKETVRMNPLEDIVVAVRAKNPEVPFGLPHSYRALDPSQPLNATSGFTQVDPKTGNPATVTNVMADLKSEYVWHCHILGHEENDFMRPFVFDAKEIVPAAPSANVNNLSGGGVQVTWSDPTPAGAANTLGNKANEIGFRVERATVSATGTIGAYAALGKTTVYTSVLPGATTGATPIVFKPTVNTLANAVSYTDTSATGGTAVVAPAAPTAMTASVASSTTVNLGWSFSGTNPSGFYVYRNGVQIAAIAGTARTYVDSAALTGSATYEVAAFNSAGSYSYRVAAVTAVGETYSQAVTVPTAAATSTKVSASVTVVNLVAPTGLAANLVTATGTTSALTSSVQLSFTDGSLPLATGFAVEACVGASTACTTTAAVDAGAARTNLAYGSTGGPTLGRWYKVTPAAVTLTAGTGGADTIRLAGLTLADNSGTAGSSVYSFRVKPTAGTQVGPVSNISATMDLKGSLAVPGTATAVSGSSAGQAVMAWTDAANNNVGYTVQRRTAAMVSSANVSSAGTGYVSAPTVTFSAPPAGGSAPVATATIGTSGGNAGRVTGITITRAGYGYTTAPTATLSAPPQTSRVASVSVSASGSGYTSGRVNVTFSAPQVAGGTTATGTATIGTGANAGKVTGITVTNAGSGYTSAPTVTISNATGGTGTGAIATAALTTPSTTGTTATATTSITAAGTWANATVTPTTNGIAAGTTVTGLSSGTPYQFQVQTSPVTGGAAASAYVQAPASNGVVVAP